MVLLLVAMTGAPWAALQSVAWTTMLADNLRTHSLAEAVKQTFDGRHPCCLCKAIAAAKKSGAKNECTRQTQKLEFPPAPEKAVLIAPSSFQLFPQTNLFAESLIQRPQTPPPRGVFA
jgi:hypothetical protein